MNQQPHIISVLDGLATMEDGSTVALDWPPKARSPMLQALSAQAIQSIFDEEEIDALAHGECLDFAAGLSHALQGVPHSFMLMLAPEGRKTLVAHVVVEIDGQFADSKGLHDKTDLLIEWSDLSGIASHRFSFVTTNSIDDVREFARKLGCTFESDNAEQAIQIGERIKALIA